MVAKPASGSGGIGHQLEELSGLNWTATITGGDTHARRYRNDYSKVRHAEQDQARKVQDHEFPDISLPQALGGIR